MFANYQVVDYNTRLALGNGAPYAAALIADWVGLLTGTITNVNQLSNYADKTLSFIQGNPGNWEVYDSNAWTNYANQYKVLRRLGVDGVTYHYILIGFHSTGADTTTFFCGHIAGWNIAEKKASSRIYTFGGTVSVNPNVAITGASILPTTQSLSASSQANPPTGYKILSTPASFSFWPEASLAMDNYPIFSMAEFENLSPWNTTAAGVVPIIAGGGLSSYSAVKIPWMRNTVGSLVFPDYITLYTSHGNGGNQASGNNSWSSPSSNVYDYTRDAAGNKVIPILPIDLDLRVNTAGYLCYAGRIRDLYATLPALNPSDTFTVGADTFVVIPTGAANPSLPNYSANGKLCAKIQ